ncbi:MAG: Porin [uncultured Sulfurovum sp.]|uniref:Porin n=1 Tax=uncultured Sulfurovum sp. TaxID=269237 RepID=A0A6S6TIL0_9BACT|nr:MAG: Porin [uncultured Sulfurovum sp.]
MLKYKIFKILLLISLYTTASFADDWDFLSVNGFGTLGVAYQDNKEVLYRDSFFTDNGSKGDISFDNYSLFGLQVDAKVTDQLSLTLQGIASVNNENDKFIDLEWANLKYQITDTFDIKVGLMRLPIFMYSDILNVAYSYEPIRLPNMYSIASFNKYKGAELSHRLEWENTSLLSTVVYGQTNTDNLKGFRANGTVINSNVDADKLYGVALKLLYEDLTLRASYFNTETTVSNSNIERAFAQFDAMGIPVISNTIEKYKSNHSPVSYVNLAAKYDFENAYLLGEYMDINSDSFVTDLDSWNIRAGYNFETWAPFVGYSKSKSSSNYDAIATAGIPPQMLPAIAGANQVFSAISEGPTEANLEAVSLGVRYDLSDNAVLKFQYDEQKRENETLRIFSSAINFVF